MAQTNLSEEEQRGAAAMLCYLRDLFTTAPVVNYPREHLLVILETISRDSDFFDDDLGVKMWQFDTEGLAP